MNWTLQQLNRIKWFLIETVLACVLIGIVLYFIGSPVNLFSALGALADALMWLLSHGIALGKAAGSAIGGLLGKLGSLFH